MVLTVTCTDDCRPGRRLAATQTIQGQRSEARGAAPGHPCALTGSAGSRCSFPSPNPAVADRVVRDGFGAAGRVYPLRHLTRHVCRSQPPTGLSDGSNSSRSRWPIVPLRTSSARLSVAEAKSALSAAAFMTRASRIATRRPRTSGPAYRYAADGASRCCPIVADGSACGQAMDNIRPHDGTGALHPPPRHRSVPVDAARVEIERAVALCGNARERALLAHPLS